MMLERQESIAIQEIIMVHFYIHIDRLALMVGIWNQVKRKCNEESYCMVMEWKASHGLASVDLCILGR
jgi:hypothetical protein